MIKTQQKNIIHWFIRAILLDINIFSKKRTPSILEKIVRLLTNNCYITIDIGFLFVNNSKCLRVKAFGFITSFIKKYCLRETFISLYCPDQTSPKKIQTSNNTNKGTDKRYLPSLLMQGTFSLVNCRLRNNHLC